MTDLRSDQSIRAKAGEEAVAPLDFKEVRQYLGFFFRAVQRRKLLAATVFILTILVTVAVLGSTPKSYHVETRILAQRQQALPMIARSTSGDESPTYAAWEIVHRRDNLLSLIEKTHLLERSKFTRSDSLSLLRDNLLSLIEKKTRLSDRRETTETPNLSRDEKLNTLVMLLDAKLLVLVGEGTLTISIDWPDPEMAFQLVEAALQNFLEARRVSEISTIDEAIAVLEARAEGLRSEIEATQTQKVRGKSDQAGLQEGRQGESRTPRYDLLAAHLKAMLDARRRIIKDAEEFRQRHVEELQIQLAEKLAVYGESYPNVVDLKREIQAFSQEPQRITALRVEERELEAAYNRRIGKTESEDEEAPTELKKKIKRPVATRSGEKEEPEAGFRHARLKYETLLERIESARIDLDGARTAFKYRYSIIWPAQIPTSPDRPNVWRGLILGSILALFLGALAATVADIRAGLFLERWQVERVLDLPVLGEVRKR